MKRRPILFTLIALITLWWSQAYAQEGEPGKEPRTNESTFAEGLAVTYTAGETASFIDMGGKVVLKIPAHEARGFSNDLAAVRLEKKWGYIDKKGKYVIIPQFDEAMDFSEGLAPVKKGTGWGVINKKGEMIVGYVYEELKRFNGGLAPAKQNGKWGFISEKGKFVIKPMYLDAGEFSEKLAPVKTAAADNAWGFINAAGKFVIEAQFDGARAFIEGLAPVQIDTKWGYIDKKGKLAINPGFDDALPFSEGLAAVQVGGKWGYINAKGKAVLEPQFTGASSFSSGFALVSGGGEWVFIDKKGKKSLAVTGTVGKWTPPQVALWDIDEAGNNGTQHADFTIYNYTTETYLISTQTNSGYFGQLNGLKLPPNTSYALSGHLSKGSKDFNGYIFFDTGGINNGFHVWLFTSSTAGTGNGLTLVDAAGKLGRNFLGDYYCWDSENNICPTRNDQMYDIGVELVVQDFKVYVSKTVDKCGKQGCIQGCPVCGTPHDPVAILIVPKEWPTPSPY